MNVFENYIYKCDHCSNVIEISPFVSSGINELIKYGWEFKFKKIYHLMPERIKKKDSRYDLTLESVRPETNISITCKDCINSLERKNKIKNILHGIR